MRNIFFGIFFSTIVLFFLVFVYYNLKITDNTTDYYLNYIVNGTVVSSKKGNRGSYKAMLYSKLVIYTDWYSKTKNNDLVLVKAGDSIVKENCYFKVFHQKRVDNKFHIFDTLYFTYLELDTSQVRCSL